jgi:MFS family permease
MFDASVSSVGEPAQTAYPRPAVAWYATIVLALMYWLSVLDRFIISLLVGPIKADLGLSDTQFGLLNGFAFAITFCLFGLIAGAVADRYSRRWVIFTGVSIWSISTALCGAAQSFWHMMAARVGVGAGEAALSPSATSMLTDLFPREKLTSAIAVYSIGSTLGSGCAYLFGGTIVEMVSKTSTLSLPLLGELRSWQAVFFIVGIPGAFLSLLIFTLPEPIRRGSRAATKSWTFVGTAYRDLLKFIGGQRRFFICHYIGFAFASAIISGLGTWYPAFLGRSFGWHGGQIGLTLGITIASAGLVGAFVCGRCVDAMMRRGRRDAQLLWYAGCLIVATPLGIVATTSSNPWVFVCCIWLFLVLTGSLGTCANTALNLVTPGALRGTGVAFFSATAGLVGAGVGPLMIAMVSDKVFHSEAAIGLGMATMIAICCPAAAISLMIGCKAMRRAPAIDNN